jgi:hypothetical protein
MSLFSDFKRNNLKLSGEHHKFIRQQLSFLLNKVCSIDVCSKDFSFNCAHSNYGLEYEYPYGYVIVLLYEDNLQVSFNFDHDNLFKGINSFFYNVTINVDNNFNYLSAIAKNSYTIGGVQHSHDNFALSCIDIHYSFDKDAHLSILMYWHIAEDPLIKFKLNKLPELSQFFVYNKDVHYYFNYFMSKYHRANDSFYQVFEGSHPSIVNQDIVSFVKFLLNWMNTYGENLNLLKTDMSVLEMAEF